MSEQKSPTGALGSRPRLTPAHEWKPRDLTKLRHMLGVLCRTVWDQRVPSGEHLWSIPVDKERDFDCMFSDAFDELEHLRAARASVGDTPPSDYETVKHAVRAEFQALQKAFDEKCAENQQLREGPLHDYYRDLIDRMAKEIATLKVG